MTQSCIIGGSGSQGKDLSNINIKDDLYLSVNGEWLKKAKIPADKSSTGGFAKLSDDIEKLLMNDFQDMLDNKTEPNNVLLANFINYYKLALNYEQRNKLGYKPVKTFIDKVNELNNYCDLQEELSFFVRNGIDVPFPIYVAPDMKDAKHYCLHAAAAGLILPDTTYYKEEQKESAEQLLGVFTNMVSRLMQLAGFNDDEIKKTISEALQLDKKMAAYELSNEEKADYPKSYNPESLSDFDERLEVISLSKFINQVIPEETDKIIVTDKRYYDHLNSIFSEDNFNEVKSWMLVNVILNWTGILSDDIRKIGGEYGRILSGKKEAPNKQKAAFYLAYGQYNMVVGDYYARKYFGSKAKKDVINMVHKMIDVYKERLENNDWLSDDTKRKAIVKLNNLVPNVGYPDKIDPIFAQFVVDENDTLFNNDLKFTRLAIQDEFNHLHKEVDRTMWEDMDPATVNAYYDPSNNIIVFPAAILQKPFYDLSQTDSENFGGIGAVMAHEISHAFDNNGAQFDEFGNLNNWWTDDDLKHFKKLTQAMIDQFDGIEVSGGKVKGKQVVSENVADQGGLSCALEAAKKDDNFDVKSFFINWAKIWCMKSTTEYDKLLLSIDVHSPHNLRANICAQNLDDFYEAFDVNDTDGMWIDPKDRVAIW